MARFIVRYTDGTDSVVVADKMVPAVTKALPAHYDFYENQALVRRIFAHALKEEPFQHGSGPQVEVVPRATTSRRRGSGL